MDIEIFTYDRARQAVWLIITTDYGEKVAVVAVKE